MLWLHAQLRTGFGNRARVIGISFCLRYANHCSPSTYSIRQWRLSELVDVPDCRRDSHFPPASIKRGQTSQLMESEALQETAGFQTAFSFLMKISNCNRSCSSHICTWLLKRVRAEFLLLQAAETSFPLPYLLTAHRFRAGCATMALHNNVRDQLTRDFHNTSAESGWL